jgi:glycosyltransferase involved in cell wall biosynthesis
VPDDGISVIVPTYNRAPLLERTLPTYLQGGASELIVVDDCSSDDTRAAVARIAARDGRVRYLRSERNLKQTHAKNLGIDAARFDLLYFGDDDSVLLEGALDRLASTMAETEADIVGACSLYMRSEEDDADMDGFLSERPWIPASIVEPVRLRTHFNSAGDGPVAAPFVHSAFLCRATVARAQRFDEGYVGNCYREETDFLVRAGAAGARIVYEPRAVQANLPRATASGGAHGNGGFVVRKLRYAVQSARNNRRFVRKNRKALAAVLGVDVSPSLRQALFLIDLGRGMLEYLIRKVFVRGA